MVYVSRFIQFVYSSKGRSKLLPKVVYKQVLLFIGLRQYIHYVLRRLSLVYQFWDHHDWCICITRHINSSNCLAKLNPIDSNHIHSSIKALSIQYNNPETRIQLFSMKPTQGVHNNQKNTIIKENIYDTIFKSLAKYNLFLVLFIDLGLFGTFIKMFTDKLSYHTPSCSSLAI